MLLDAVRDDVEKLVCKELDSANRKFPLFRSSHEGAAVIREEIDEVEYALKRINGAYAELWSTVKNNSKGTQWAHEMNRWAINLAVEAIQVAAMGQKYMDSIGQNQGESERIQERMGSDGAEQKRAENGEKDG